MVLEDIFRDLAGTSSMLMLPQLSQTASQLLHSYYVFHDHAQVAVRLRRPSARSNPASMAPIESP